MTKREKLTASQIRYLLTLKQMSAPEGNRVSDIAKQLGLSKPSVHNMMDTFLRLDFVMKKPGGKVSMTEQGLRTAMYYEAYFERMKCGLSAYEGVDESIDMAIYAFLAELSEPCLLALSQKWPKTE